MSSIKDVAKKAGVAISTVSNVLNKTKYVSPELEDKVYKAIEELNYEVNPIARRMKNKQSWNIGIIVEDMCGLFYPYIVKGINEVLTKEGYSITICDTQGANGQDDKTLEREERHFTNLLSSRVDGIIFATAIPNEKKHEYFQMIQRKMPTDKRIPIVSVERDLTEEGFDSVFFNSYENAVMAVEHLISRGCKKIGHITGPKSLVIATDRIRGYKDCMKKHQLPFNEEKMIVHGNYTHQSGYIGMKTLLEKLPDIDGVFCGNDQMAIGALKYLKEIGKNVPRDIKVMGYDDVFVSSILEPGLTSVHIKKRRTGVEAAKLLLKRLEQLKEDEAAVFHPIGICMQAEIIVRKSTAKSSDDDWMLYEW